MKISYKISTTTTMYNRKYAKNKVGAKALDITLSRESEESFSADKLKEIATAVDNTLDGNIVINVEDPYMIQILEPKSGATVHNRLNELKRNLATGKTYEFIGDTIPPETRNGYKALVLGADYDVTLEGLAEWILRSANYITHVVISDGSVVVELDHNDIKEPDQL